MAGIQAKSSFGKIDEGTKKIEPFFITGQPIGSNRYGLDVIALMAYAVATGHTAGAGSTTQVINRVAHGAKVGDIVVFQSGTQNEFEVHVLKIIDNDYFELAGICSASLVGATYDLLRPKTPKVDITGATLATVTPSPIMFDLNGVDTEVKKDTGTPANSRGLPVEIISASGMVINVTTGDIGVQLDHAGANPDSVRIGDGVEQLAINANLEALVHDTDALAKQAQIYTELLLKAKVTDTQPVSIASLPLPTGSATEAKQDAGNLSLSNIDTKLPATLGQKPMATSLAVTLASDQSALPVTGPLTDAQLRATAVPVSGTFWQATQPVSAASLPLPTGASTEAKQDAEAILIGAVNESAPASDTASSGLNGRLQRIAQNLSTLIARIPASLGIKTAANSLSVVLASDGFVNSAPGTGTFAEDLALATVVTFTAPAGAWGAIVLADETNAASLRVKQGAVATSTSGLQFQPGRSEKLESGSNISICSESGTNKVAVQWFVR